MASVAQSSQMSPSQQNAAARSLILRGGQLGNLYVPPALDDWVPLNPQLPSSPAPGTVITFYIRNVGLIKRLIARFTATVTAGASSTQTLTPWGLSNLISNVTFTDYGNQQRINTSGWHLSVIASAKRRGPFGAAYTTDTPLGMGNNNTKTMVAPSTIAANGSAEIDFQLEIPFCKNDMDLRGALYGDVTQSTAQVQVTLNPNMFVASTADPTLALYQSGGSDLATISSVKFQVFQNFLDNIPRQANGYAILPALDIGTAYLLNASASGVPVQSVDNNFSFVNARSYESVTFGYDNNGTLNVNGTDLNYVAVQSANFTPILYFDPKMLALYDRQILSMDFPKGMYYLDFRHRPIDTNQFGNMQLTINPSSVGGSGAAFLFGWESFGVIGQVNQGGAIPSGSGG